MPKKNPKPEDYEQLFRGNIDDNFRIGLSVTKKSVKVSETHGWWISWLCYLFFKSSL